MKRRGFLQALGIALAAPAIVKAENLMKIVVPKKEIIVPDTNLITGLGTGDFTMEMWAKPPVDGQWHHLAISRANGRVNFYVDGVASNERELTARGWQHMEFKRTPGNGSIVKINSIENRVPILVDDLRITHGVVRPVEKIDPSRRRLFGMSEQLAHMPSERQRDRAAMKFGSDSLLLNF